jgi:hypothetical protein
LRVHILHPVQLGNTAPLVAAPNTVSRGGPEVAASQKSRRELFPAHTARVARHSGPGGCVSERRLCEHAAWAAV